MDEKKICGTCRYYNSNIPCGTTPSACKKADKFAEEFVDELKKLKPTAKPCKDDLIRRSDAIKALGERPEVWMDMPEEIQADNDWVYHKNAIEAIPTVEPNLLIAPETIERGSELYIGEDIVVVHHEDYMDMMCKAMMWDEYGKEPKQGEWIDKHGEPVKCSICGAQEDKFVEGWGEWEMNGESNFCPNCGADMRKGADDECVL